LGGALLIRSKDPDEVFLPRGLPSSLGPAWAQPKGRRDPICRIPFQLIGFQKKLTIADNLRLDDEHIGDGLRYSIDLTVFFGAAN
jgi:hypothetical protein